MVGVNRLQQFHCLLAGRVVDGAIPVLGMRDLKSQAVAGRRSAARLAHQKLIHMPSRLASLGDGPDDQGLAAAAVAGGENSGASRHIACVGRGGLQAEGRQDRAFWAGETYSDKGDFQLVGQVQFGAVPLQLGTAAPPASSK